MCTGVLAGDQEITTIRELAAFFVCAPEDLPGGPETKAHVDDEGDGATDWRDYCLCSIDVPKAARRFGYRAEPNGLGFELTKAAER